MQLSRQITGPAPFSLERLFAIYESILIELEGDNPEFDREMTRVQLLSTVCCLFLSGSAAAVELTHRTW